MSSGSARRCDALDRVAAAGLAVAGGGEGAETAVVRRNTAVTSALYGRAVPEVLFDVRWPDGSRQTFYSPSLIVEERFSAGADYPVADFVDTSRVCMRIADQRVREKFGFGCSQSVATLAGIEQAAARFAGTDRVTLEAFRR